MFADVAAVWGSWAQVVIAAVAVGGVGYTFFRWMRKHIADPLQEVPVIRAAQITMRADVLNIQEQLKPNHGTSLRDSNDRTEVLVRAVADRIGVDAQSIVDEQNPPDRGVT